MHICEFVVIPLISLSHITDLFSVYCFSLSFTLLWTCCETIQHVIYWDSLSSVKRLLFIPPLPLPLLLKATLYADKTILMVFELRYSVIPDLTFYSFRQNSHHSPWSMTAMLGYDESHKMQRELTFFCHPLRCPNSRHPIHLQEPCLVILSTDYSLSLSPTPSLFLQ